MHKEVREELRVRLKLVVLKVAHHVGVTKACQEYNVPRASFYRWKQKYEKAGRSGLYRERPIAYHHSHRTSPEVVEKILAIRTEHQIGALRILYYLDRYHGIKISESTVSRVLKVHGLSWLPRNAPRRALHTQRYAKTVLGHHVQVDVKFLQLKDHNGKLVKRYQRWQIGRTLFERGELNLTHSSTRAYEYYSQSLGSFEEIQAAPNAERTRVALSSLG